MDVKTLFSAITAILLLVSLIMIFSYKQNPENSAIKYLALFIVLHFIGFVGFILRNQIPDFLSIVVANTLFGAGTLSLYLATKAITNKTPIWYNRYLIPLLTYFIGFIIFTYVEYDTSIRIFIYYLFCFIYTSAIAWLFWFNDSVRFRVFDRVSAIFFAALSIIFLGVVFQTSFTKLQAYYFSNTNTFMILSIFIMILLNLWTVIATKYRIKN